MLCLKFYLRHYLGSKAHTEQMTASLESPVKWQTREGCGLLRLHLSKFTDGSPVLGLAVDSWGLLHDSVLRISICTPKVLNSNYNIIYKQGGIRTCTSIVSCTTY